MQQGRFVKRWFVLKDTFLLCYNSREDMNNPQDGQRTGRRFVLPLMGMLVWFTRKRPFRLVHVLSTDSPEIFIDRVVDVRITEPRVPGAPA